MIIKSICVFCGSGSGANPLYLQAAQNLGEAIAQANLFMHTTVIERFIKPEHVNKVMVEAEPAALLQRFAAYVPMVQPMWVKP